MALKRKLTKAEFDGLNDVLKAEYKQNGDTYVLDTDDAAELINAKRAEIEAHNGTKADRDRLQAELAELQQAHARKTGDFSSIENSYKQQIEALQAQVTAAQGETQTVIKSFTVDKIAADIAQMSTVPSLFMPAVTSRLTVEMVDNKPVVRVLGTDGKPTAASIDDLKKELATNPEYKHIIKTGSQATGSTVADGKGGSAPFAPTTGQTPSMSNMKPHDLVAAIKQTGFTGE